MGNLCTSFQFNYKPKIALKKASILKKKVRKSRSFQGSWYRRQCPGKVACLKQPTLCYWIRSWERFWLISISWCSETSISFRWKVSTIRSGLEEVATTDCVRPSTILRLSVRLNSLMLTTNLFHRSTLMGSGMMVHDWPMLHWCELVMWTVFTPSIWEPWGWILWMAEGSREEQALMSGWRGGEWSVGSLLMTPFGRRTER